MFTHSKLWSAIDQLARNNGYSASGLAKKAGLDPTSFNKSKRKAKDGKPRWPSTESISKVLAATGATMSDFIALMGEKGSEAPVQQIQPQEPPEPVIIEKEVIVEKFIEKEVPMNTAPRELPLLQDDMAVDAGVFDENGFPSGSAASFFALPDGQPALSPRAWAMEITGSSFAPYYQEGDILLIDPAGPARAGDPFLIRRRSEDKLAVYRGQSANPAIGDPLGRIMGVFYSMTNMDEEIAA